MVLCFGGAGMKIFLELGTNVGIDLETEEMSPRGAADYAAAQDVCRSQHRRRQDVLQVLADTPVTRAFSKAETQVLDALGHDHKRIAPETLHALTALKNPLALAAAAQLIDINLEETKARRMVAIIARDEYYDAQMKKAHQGNAELDRRYAALLELAETSKDAERELKEHAKYYETNVVKLRLEDLRRFDQHFFNVFNGEMLTAIHRYEEARMILAGHDLTQPAAAVSEKQVIRPAVTAIPACNP